MNTQLKPATKKFVGRVEFAYPKTKLHVMESHPTTEEAAWKWVGCAITTFSQSAAYYYLASTVVEVEARKC